MARSRRKTPIRGNCADSDQWDKRKANRRLRKANRMLMLRDGVDVTLRLLREVSNVWTAAKDGKFRFDKAAYPELMRK